MWDEGRGGGEPVPGEREDGRGAGGGEWRGRKREVLPVLPLRLCRPDRELQN